jgi:hypothetical protein
MEPNEAIDPTDRIEPTDAIDSTEPFDPIERNESSDQSDSREFLDDTAPACRTQRAESDIPVVPDWQPTRSSDLPPTADRARATKCRGPSSPRPTTMLP